MPDQTTSETFGMPANSCPVLVLQGGGARRLIGHRDGIGPPRDGESMVVYELTDDDNPLKRM